MFREDFLMVHMFWLLLAHLGRFRFTIYFKNKVKNIIRVQLGLKIRNVNPCPSVSGHLTLRVTVATTPLFPKWRALFNLKTVFPCLDHSHEMLFKLFLNKRPEMSKFTFLTKSDIIRLTHIIPEKTTREKNHLISTLFYFWKNYETYLHKVALFKILNPDSVGVKINLSLS